MVRRKHILRAGLIAFMFVGGSHAATTSSFAAPPVPAHFTGEIALFGKVPATSPAVKAYVGATECGTATVTKGIYAINVVSSQDKPGCGQPGFDVSFTIGDYWANETATWNPDGFWKFDLTGPRFKGVDLPAGCSDDIKVTFANNTAIGDFIQGIQPPLNVSAIWRKGTAATWQSYFPGALELDNTLKTLNRNDTVTICLSDQSTLWQPVPTPSPAKPK